MSVKTRDTQFSSESRPQGVYMMVQRTVEPFPESVTDYTTAEEEVLIRDTSRSAVQVTGQGQLSYPITEKYLVLSAEKIMREGFPSSKDKTDKEWVTRISEQASVLDKYFSLIGIASKHPLRQKLRFLAHPRTENGRGIEDLDRSAITYILEKTFKQSQAIMLFPALSKVRPIGLHQVIHHDNPWEDLANSFISGGEGSLPGNLTELQNMNTKANRVREILYGEYESKFLKMVDNLSETDEVASYLMKADLIYQLFPGEANKKFRKGIMTTIVKNMDARKEQDRGQHRDTLKAEIHALPEVFYDMREGGVLTLVNSTEDERGFYVSGKYNSATPRFIEYCEIDGVSKEKLYNAIMEELNMNSNRIASLKSYYAAVVRRYADLYEAWEGKLEYLPVYKEEKRFHRTFIDAKEFDEIIDRDIRIGEEPFVDYKKVYNDSELKAFNQEVGNLVFKMPELSYDIVRAGTEMSNCLSSNYVSGTAWEENFHKRLVFVFRKGEDKILVAGAFLVDTENKKITFRSVLSPNNNDPREPFSLREGYDFIKYFQNMYDMGYEFTDAQRIESVYDLAKDHPEFKLPEEKDKGEEKEFDIPQHFESRLENLFYNMSKRYIIQEQGLSNVLVRKLANHMDYLVPGMIKDALKYLEDDRPNEEAKYHQVLDRALNKSLNEEQWRVARTHASGIVEVGFIGTKIKELNDDNSRYLTEIEEFEAVMSQVGSTSSEVPMYAVNKPHDDTMYNALARDHDRLILHYLVGVFYKYVTIFMSYAYMKNFSMEPDSLNNDKVTTQAKDISRWLDFQIRLRYSMDLIDGVTNGFEDGFWIQSMDVGNGEFKGRSQTESQFAKQVRERGFLGV